jgi:hypothetical protein
MAVETEDILFLILDRFNLNRDNMTEKVRLQLIIYLLYTLKIVRMGYGFSWGRCRPYNDDLIYDAYSILKDRDKYTEKTKDYKFCVESDNKIKAFQNFVNENLTDVNKLELVASIRYIIVVWGNSEYPDVNKENVFKYLYKHKKVFTDGSIFVEAQVLEAFDIYNKMMNIFEETEMSINGMFEDDIQSVIRYLKTMKKEMLAHEVELMIDDLKHYQSTCQVYKTKIIELYVEQLHLKLCDFKDECDFCQNPIGDVYACMIYGDVAEAKYHICTECIFKRAMKENK